MICRHDGFYANACVRGLCSSLDHYFDFGHKLKVKPEYSNDFWISNEGKFHSQL